MESITADQIDPYQTATDQAQVPTDQQAVPVQPVAQTVDAPEKQESAVEILHPKAEVKAWKIGIGSEEMELVQRPLSLFKKMEWFALVGDVVDRAMSGPNPLTLGNLFNTPATDGGVLRPEDFRDADTFIQAVGKLISYMPDFMERSFCIWLNVPDYRRAMVIETMSLPKEEGGLSDDDGLEIIEIFIDQNYEAIQTIFGDKMGKLRKRIEARQKGVARK